MIWFFAPNIGDDHPAVPPGGLWSPPGIVPGGVFRSGYRLAMRCSPQRVTFRRASEAARGNQLRRGHGQQWFGLLDPEGQPAPGIAENGTSEPARVVAAVALLDRGWGKPKLDAAVQGEIRVTIRKMLGDDDEEDA